MVSPAHDVSCGRGVLKFYLSDISDLADRIAAMYAGRHASPRVKSREYAELVAARLQKWADGAPVYIFCDTVDGDEMWAREHDPGGYEVTADRFEPALVRPRGRYI